MFSRALQVLALSTCFSAFACAAPESDVIDDEEAVATKDRFQFQVGAEQREEGPARPSLQNAYWMARLSAMAYAPRPQTPQALKKLGLKPGPEGFLYYLPLTNSQTGADGFYVRIKNAGFLIFRGSEKKKSDWLTNFDKEHTLRIGPGHLEAHRGFQNAVNSIWKADLLEVLRAHRGPYGLPLYVGGHSLGGSMATLAAYKLMFSGCDTPEWANRATPIDRTGESAGSMHHYAEACLNDAMNVAGLYTFGQPKPGYKELADTIDWRLREQRVAYARFVDDSDLIPEAPLWIPGRAYTHVGPSLSPWKNIRGIDEMARVHFLTHCGELKYGETPGRFTIQWDGRLGLIDDHKAELYANRIAGVIDGKPVKGSNCKP
jgi:Lipase (class 3)